MNFSRVKFETLKNALSVCKHFRDRSFSCGQHRAMKFVQYKDAGGRRGLGVQMNDSDQIVSLSAVDQTIPEDMVSFLHSKYSIEKVKK